MARAREKKLDDVAKARHERHLQNVKPTKVWRDGSRRSKRHRTESAESTAAE